VSAQILSCGHLRVDYATSRQCRSILVHLNNIKREPAPRHEAVGLGIATDRCRKLPLSSAIATANVKHRVEFRSSRQDAAPREARWRSANRLPLFGE
jgi:hypothetical protein